MAERARTVPAVDEGAVRAFLVILLVLAAAMLLTGCSRSGRDRSASSRRTDDAKHEGEVAGAVVPGGHDLARAAGGPTDSVGRLEVAALFWGPMPTGVAASQEGRVFVNFPRWGDDVKFTVAEVRGGTPQPFPPDLAQDPDADPAAGLVSVQSVVVDPADRLWLLDTGSTGMGQTKPGGPKLVAVDLAQNKVVKTISFPEDVALPTTYLNDVRFDLTRGDEGMAFITDSSDKGPNAIIVVDLASGRSWRKLSGHRTTTADEDFVPTVEGEPFMVRPPGNFEPQPIKIGADGIAISADGKRLYFCPLASRRLHSVSIDALADENMSDEEVEATVEDMPVRDFASDGLEQDAQGRVYLTDYEHNAVRRLNTDGSYEVIAQDPTMIWPDTLALSSDGYLYITANQLNRQARFHQAQDLRQRPFVLFRTKVDASPVDLK